MTTPPIDTTTASRIAALPAAPLIPAALADALGDGSARPPAQQGQRWMRQRWLAEFAGVPGAAELLGALPAPLDRAQVVQHVHAQRGAGRTDLAFIVAMIWGYGTVGYGPHRTMQVLSAGTGAVDRGVLARLDAGADAAVADGPVAGFYVLNNEAGAVADLGPAFFTKWLSFVSASDGDPDSPSAAPILDQVVSRWVRAETGVSLAYKQTVAYARYVAMLDAWGARPAGLLSRATVERVIFEMAR